MIGGQVDLGPTFSMVGNFNIILDSGATDSPEAPLEIRVLFANLALKVQQESGVLVQVVGNGEFEYIRGKGLLIESFNVTSFDFLPEHQSAATIFSNPGGVVVGLDQSGSGLQPASQNLPVTIKFGSLTLTQIELNVVDLGVLFTEDFQVQLSISVAISIKTVSLALVGDFAAKISDRKDSDEVDGDDDEYAIIGTFITDAVLDPNQNFAQSAGDPGEFDFQIDTIEVTIGRLFKTTAIDSVFTPTAEGRRPWLKSAMQRFR